jgi:hypothetical protein
VLSLSPSAVRHLEAVRDRILYRAGTSEPFVTDDPATVEGETGVRMVAMHWRKPLSLEEVNQMAPTPAVRTRQGRP